jgi:hypothetical protein
MVRNAFLGFLSLATLVAVPSSAWAQEGQRPARPRAR